MAELRRRMHRRGADGEEQAEVREREADEEMASAEEFDYTVVNDDLARAAGEIAAILEREREDPGRRAIVFD
jgi:guanylate kinase